MTGQYDVHAMAKGLRNKTATLDGLATKYALSTAAVLAMLRGAGYSHWGTRIEPRKRHDWRDLALCAEVDSELFFPDKGGVEESRDARAVCANCEVRLQCLDDALRTDERYGVRGGLSARERRALKRRRSA